MNRRLTAGTLVCALAGLLAAACGSQAPPGQPRAATPGVTKLAQPTAVASGRPVPVPGCSARAGSAPGLPASLVSLIHVGGTPFGVAGGAGGRWAFVSSAGPGIQVLRSGTRPALVRAGTVTVRGGQLLGETLTRDGRYLLAATGPGVAVISVRAAQQRRPHALLGTLAAPRGVGAIEVAVTPDGRLAFVSLEYSDDIAVFDLHRALTRGFGPADYVGLIPAGLAPVGLAVSPDGRWLYSTSEVARGSTKPQTSDGTLSVISVRRAATDPARSVVGTVPAGCQPVRVITSADGRVAWVTARGSNALLGFSTALLRSRLSGALIARVAVGTAPVGLALVAGGRRIVVADSNRFQVAGATSSLAVVRVPEALAGRPALAGLLRAGRFPRDMALEPGGRVLLVTCFASGQVEVVHVPGLP